jgi:NhaP-type Na+/H+ or K+/H+ antiporter
MRSFINVFFEKSPIIVALVFAIYLILISILTFDRKEINVFFNYGFWLVFGCFIGYYWSLFASKHLKKHKKGKETHLSIVDKDE